MTNEIDAMVVRLDRISDRLALLGTTIKVRRENGAATSRGEAQNLRLAEAKVEAARLAVAEATLALGLVS